ncbi:MAG: RNA-guided endonuclease InsQ/TnpB family protein [Desulfonatronovibrionaceae bacterium]
MKTMIIRKGYKFRLKLQDGDKQQFSQFAGCCRFVWNKALAMQDGLFLDENEKLLPKTKLLNLLAEWKQEHPFLKDSHSQILQQTLIDLDRAYQNFFRRLKNGEAPGYPRYKKKFVHDSFRFPQGFRIENRHVYLPKLGWFRFYKSREIEGTPKNVTVSRDGKHWDISVQVEQEISDPCPAQEPSTGLDMGISRFYTCSDGTFGEPLNAFRKVEKKLAKEQRKLSRKKEFSRNWKKQKAKVNKVHRKIRDVRLDYLHKHSTFLAESYIRIYAEDLQIKNMSCSAKGTQEEPGKNVRAKSGLNKSILDQGWGEFMRQLDYKLNWRGGKLVKVPPHHTSQTCSGCGHVSKMNRKSQGRFVCERCGLVINADHNAAINLRTLGQRGMACGSNRTSGRKQELSGNGDIVPALPLSH